MAPHSTGRKNHLVTPRSRQLSRQPLLDGCGPACLPLQSSTVMMAAISSLSRCPRVGWKDRQIPPLRRACTRFLALESGETIRHWTCTRFVGWSSLHGRLLVSLCRGPPRARPEVMAVFPHTT